MILVFRFSKWVVFCHVCFYCYYCFCFFSSPVHVPSFIVYYVFLFDPLGLSYLFVTLSLMYIFPVAVMFVRLMADLTPLLPPAPTTLLSPSLPCGFAVGPSQLCAGRLGLWWVGRSLEAGSLLGSEGDTEWPWKCPVNTQTENGNSNLAVSPYFGDKHTDSTWIEKIRQQKQTKKKYIEQMSYRLCVHILGFYGGSGEWKSLAPDLDPVMCVHCNLEPKRVDGVRILVHVAAFHRVLPSGLPARCRAGPSRTWPCTAPVKERCAWTPV